MLSTLLVSCNDTKTEKDNTQEKDAQEKAINDSVQIEFNEVMLQLRDFNGEDYTSDIKEAVHQFMLHVYDLKFFTKNMNSESDSYFYDSYHYERGDKNFIDYYVDFDTLLYNDSIRYYFLNISYGTDSKKSHLFFMTEEDNSFTFLNKLIYPHNQFNQIEIIKKEERNFLVYTSSGEVDVFGVLNGNLFHVSIISKIKSKTIIYSYEDIELQGNFNNIEGNGDIVFDMKYTITVSPDFFNSNRSSYILKQEPKNPVVLIDKNGTVTYTLTEDKPEKYSLVENDIYNKKIISYFNRVNKGGDPEDIVYREFSRIYSSEIDSLMKHGDEIQREVARWYNSRRNEY